MFNQRFYAQQNSAAANTAALFCISPTVNGYDLIIQNPGHWHRVLIEASGEIIKTEDLSLIVPSAVAPA